MSSNGYKVRVVLHAHVTYDYAYIFHVDYTWYYQDDLVASNISSLKLLS